VYVWAREQENPAKTLGKWAPIDREEQERALAAGQVSFALASPWVRVRAKVRAREQARLVIKGTQCAQRRPGGVLPLAVAAVGAGVGLLSG